MGGGLVRKTNSIIFVMALIVFAATFLLSLVSFPGVNSETSSQSREQLPNSLKSERTLKIPSGSVYTLMGKKEPEVIRTLGKPERIDPTNYGYQWYIYGINTENYLQVGIDLKTDRVTTLYVLGKNLKTAPFQIGESSQKVYQKAPILDEVAMTNAGSKIDFELNEEDMMTRPLLKLGKNWIQLNFDHISDKLVGIRCLNASVLAVQHPYSMTYTGALPNQPKVSATAWNLINNANDREIFDISNLLRYRNNKRLLTWNTNAQEAAYKHSREMKIKNYFSHGSKWSGNLQTRLQAEGIRFEMAGENIAAQYPDAPAVCLGWLNSPDHRENLLNNSFTSLGVGSYQLYYTQDFVLPMN